MQNPKLKVWLPILFALVMILGMVIGFQLKNKTLGPKFFTFNSHTAIQELVELIANKYVDKVSVDSINQLAAEELLSHLDPHSVYIPATELTEVNDDLMGNFQGIGVEFQVLKDTVTIFHVIAGGPAEQAGMELGDQLMVADDSIFLAGKQLSASMIRKKLRGPANSKLSLRILRNHQEKTLVLTRGNIAMPPIDVVYMLNDTTGYIRINKFAERTFEAFMQGLEKLQKQGMKALVLDLRGNGGGLLKEAVDIADQFLDGDKLIVYTEGNHMPRQDYRAKRDGIFETGKLVVLIDESSASASEVLAGALQDWDRATIIGRRSFGKGLVQQQFQLSDGSALHLTIARYYSPLGRNIQKSYSKGKKAYEDELAARFHNGEVISADTSKPIGKPYKTPKGNRVYGGGGITPDVFVPLDTLFNEPNVLSLFQKGTLSNFVFQYYLSKKAELKKYQSPVQFGNQFLLGNKEWESLVNFAKKDTIPLGNVKKVIQEKLLMRMQSLLARQIWRNEGYFKVNNLRDSTVQKALSSLRK